MISAQTATEDQAFSFKIPANAFADADLGDTLTYSIGIVEGWSVPAWLKFDTATRTFSGTPTNWDVRTLNIRVTATDSHGDTAHTDFALTVANVNDAPTLPDDRTASVFENVTTVFYLVDAEDIDGDDITITSATVLSGFGSVYVQDNTIIYDPTTAPNQDIAAGETRPIVIRYSVSDGHGGTATADIDVTVKGISPDIFKGTEGNDHLIGTSSGDTLLGYGGNDTLDGKGGADRMGGSIGNDTYIVDNTNDVIIEKDGEGTDSVEASASYSLSANVENLELTGSASYAVGNNLANILIGNDLDNRIDGKTGGDRMSGGKGNDTYYIEHSKDVAFEDANEGIDLVKSYRNYTLASNIENLTLMGDASEGAGNVLDNVITGNANNNLLDGKAGNDTLMTGSGSDRLVGGLGADKLYGGSGNDTFIFRTLAESTVSSVGRDMIYDFSHNQGDRIDLSDIDANTNTAPDSAFTLIGTAAFHNKAGELRYEIKGGDTYLHGDVNGDGKADFSIRFDAAINFAKIDFFL